VATWIAKPRDGSYAPGSRHLAAGLLLLAAAHTIAAQSSTPPLPALPERHDTLTVASADAVIGRGVMTWTRLGLEQLQVYFWLGAADGSPVIDSLFADPTSLVPVREVRVSGGTIVTVLYARDTVFLTTASAGASVTSWAVAPRDALFSSASIESLAATMPLERGSTRTILVFFAPPSRLGIQRVPIKVEGDEIVDGRPAWRVVAGTPGGGTTFWVGATTRTVLRSETREGSAVITFRPSATTVLDPSDRD
jgi:hypothetical protein